MYNCCQKMCEEIRINNLLNHYAEKNFELETENKKLKLEEEKSEKERQKLIKEILNLKSDNQLCLSRFRSLSRENFDLRKKIMEQDQELDKLKQSKIISIPTQPIRYNSLEDVKLTFADYFLLGTTLILAIIGIVSICLWIFAR